MRLLIFFLFLLSQTTLFAQRYINSVNIQASTGFRTSGFIANIGVEKLLTDNIGFTGKAYFSQMNRNVEKSTQKAKLFDFGIEAEFDYYFDLNTNVFPFIGIAPILGYEVLQNKNDFPTYLELEHKSQLIYKGKASLGVEFNFNSVSIVGVFSPYYDIKNKDFYYTGTIGIKYYF